MKQKAERLTIFQLFLVLSCVLSFFLIKFATNNGILTHKTICGLYIRIT